MIAKKTPLEGMKMGSIRTVTICELPATQTTDLRVAPGTETQAAMARTLGIDLSGKPGQIRSQKLEGKAETHILCLAPDWWLITGLPEAEERLADLRLTNDHHFSCVDVSGQRTSVELQGPNAREVLAHLWEQDLREKNFPAGCVSQGLIAKAPVIVCHVAASRYRVLVRSSFALHLWKAMTDAAEEWI